MGHTLEIINFNLNNGRVSIGGGVFILFLFLKFRTNITLMKVRLFFCLCQNGKVSQFFVESNKCIILSINRI